MTGPAGSDGRSIRTEAVIDLDAVRSNVAVLLQAARRSNPTAALMAVVKADGYGHGAVPIARVARQAGAVALGLATPQEAVHLVAAGLEATADRPVVAWLWVPDEDIRPAVAGGVQLVVSSVAQLAAVRAVAFLAPGGRADIHLKIDTGLGRGGATAAEFDHLVAAAIDADSQVQVVGVMSHLACADEPGDKSVPQQIAAFQAACAHLQRVGVSVRWRHLANTPGTLEWPAAVFDLVRCGIGLYGVTPFDQPHPLAAELRPAMTLRARVALTKRVAAGSGVSYGLTYRTEGPATLALVPIGYADGIPRAAGIGAQIWLRGKRRTIAGRIAMDQFVVDCGDDEVLVGDEVLVFGPGDSGEPTAVDWAAQCSTIGYEIVTRIGPRVPRRYVGSSAAGPDHEGSR